MLDDINDAYQKVYGHPMASATPAPAEAATPGQPATPGRKSKSEIASQADSEANGGKEDLSAGDYAWDGAVGVAAGVESFGKSLGRLTNDLSGAIGLGKFADDSAFDNT